MTTEIVREQMSATAQLPKNIRKGCAAYVLRWPNAVYVGYSKEVRHRLIRHKYRNRKGVKRKELYDQDWSAVGVDIYYTRTVQEAEQLETKLIKENSDMLLNMQKRWVVGFKIEDGKRLIKRYPGSKIAGKELGICDSSIVGCCRGRLKTAGGYKWRYL
jgi:predicted GIY-YIG superfamily endonuclease